MAPGLRATLGECPADLLRRAWGELLPLEAAAVEREVLALCTERSEAIAGFLSAQARLDAALAERGAAATRPAAAPDADPVPGEARMARLRGEVADLRARIARLEGEPERPETAAALEGLRDGLATAEADLARLEGGGAGASGTSPAPEAAAAGAETHGTAATPSAAESVPPPGAGPVAAAAAGNGPQGPRLSDDGAGAPLPPPGTSPAADAGAPSAPRRREGPTEWTAVFAVRADGGPWRVRLQGSRETHLPVPDAGDGDAPVRWTQVTERDPPLTLAVGDSLPDGAALLSVTPEGVEIGDPEDPDAARLVPFATADAGEPAALAWDVEVPEGGER